MCYTGKCKYENYYGDCNLKLKKGEFWPDDAGCVIAMEKCEIIEKMEIQNGNV